jgi:hypothetical protein
LAGAGREGDRDQGAVDQARKVAIVVVEAALAKAVVVGLVDLQGADAVVLRVALAVAAPADAVRPAVRILPRRCWAVASSI